MFEQVKKMIASHLGVSEDEINPETDIEADLGADSLDAVELMVAFEEEFGVSIPDDDLVAVRTVGDVCEYLEGLSHAE
jgi:acyl carrier protein